MMAGIKQVIEPAEIPALPGIGSLGRIGSGSIAELHPQLRQLRGWQRIGQAKSEKNLGARREPVR
jgi:hypothetical protein